ncbi:Uncharacterized protein APZ42_005685 [Daphnia magna]|uniref:Uncharacterized protein n=1 Tax=Daphnia magna TaxID=35525 RepID=A0A162D4S3_9CRUS|nr:Uncharacterized protein APZ42_005685 [Daphnia magna]
MDRCGDGCERWQLLQLPPDGQERNLLRHHWPQPLQLRQDPWRVQPQRPGQQGHCGIHLGQDLECQGLQRLLQHAPRWPHGHPERSTGSPHRGFVARSQVAREPVSP